MNSIRAKVVCLLRHGERMLLLRATDPSDGRSFLLPPGGGVEFGETLEQAIVREIAEELAYELRAPRRLGMLESLFRFAGRDEHELVFVYEADCDDQRLTAQAEIIVTESNGEQLPARWYTLAEAIATGLPLFPIGLAAMLDERSANPRSPPGAFGDAHFR